MTELLAVLRVDGVAALVLMGESKLLTTVGPFRSPVKSDDTLLASGACLTEASWPIQMSQSIHPRTVPAVLQLTTETGETRS